MKVRLSRRNFHAGKGKKYEHNRDVNISNDETHEKDKTWAGQFMLDLTLYWLPTRKIMLLG